MWKNLIVLTICTVCALGSPITDNKIIGKPLDALSPSTIPIFGTYLVNKYSKIAREIVHHSSKIQKFSKINKI